MTFRLALAGAVLAFSSVSLAAQQPCSLKTVGAGRSVESVYRTTPCVWTPTSPVMTGAAITSIKSNPSGAELVLNGAVVAKTPVLLVLEQIGDRSKNFVLALRKHGYEDETISVTDGDVLFVELHQKQAGESQPTTSPSVRSAAIVNKPSSIRQRPCSSRAWINAFQPEQPVFPKQSDLCPVDLGRPLFTREGTLACPTPEAMLYATSAMEHGWMSAGDLGGIDNPVPMTRPGQQVSAEYFGCTIFHAGIAVTLTEETSPLLSDPKTSIGWVSARNLRN